MEFKQDEDVYISFLKPGRRIGPIIQKLPTFIPLQGIVKYIYQSEGIETKTLSIEFSGWPLRYLLEESKCFKTQSEVDADVTRKNAELASQIRVTRA